LHDPGVDLLAIAVTMGLHLRKTAHLIERVRADVEFDRMAILVGGSIFASTPDLYRTIGADGTADSATQAVAVGRRLVESRRSI
jgi:methanogenic corrinoid protein MtbC1